MDHMKNRIDEAVLGLTDVDADVVYREYERSKYPGITERERDEAVVLAARSLVEVEPEYSFVAARLLLQSVSYEVARTNGVHPYASGGLIASLTVGFEDDRIDRELVNTDRFDHAKLELSLVPERDNLFQLLGAQTLYDRYLLNVDGKRYETPQLFFMRVAMGLAINEDNPTERAIQFYEMFSTFRFMSSTPTLFNSGTQRPQMSSCFLTTVPDSLEGITHAISNNAKLGKFSGGLGNDWTPVRANGAKIKGTNGQSSGFVPFAKVAESMLVAVNQGGKRPGAGCAYLETWHLDIEDFLDLRRNTGDERRRTHNMNTANWIPDLFMERVEADAEWYLFSPDEVPHLHDLYGNEFRVAYEKAQVDAELGRIKNFRVVPAKELWRKMLTRLFETGHPWITFKDPCNLRSPQQHVGVVHSSNLCTEITLNTSEDEVAVCNLGSVNVVGHIDNRGRIDQGMLQQTVRTAIRMLDNVIDLNLYTIPEAEKSNIRHRPIGLGMMGFHDALFEKGVAYSSDEAVEFADEFTEAMSYYAIEASSDLAQERGSYKSFEGSLWSHGTMPIDSLRNMFDHRNSGDLEVSTGYSGAFAWDELEAKVRKGMRNSNVLAIAPTATISNIVGLLGQGVDPVYQNLYVKSSQSGDFTVFNPYLVRDLKEFGLWNEEVRTALKMHDGSLQNIDGFSDGMSKYLREVYQTAFEIDPKHLVDCGARRQKWLDQSQSLNLYMAEPSGKKLDELYRHAWRSGLKSTYYLRSQGATHVEKTTLKGVDGKLTGVSLIGQGISGNPNDDVCGVCQ